MFLCISEQLLPSAVNNQQTITLQSHSQERTHGICMEHVPYLLQNRCMFFLQNGRTFSLSTRALFRTATDPAVE